MDPEGAFAAWETLRKSLPPDSPFPAHWPETRRAIEGTADPELALATWIRWIEADQAEPGEPGVQVDQPDGAEPSERVRQSDQAQPSDKAHQSERAQQDDQDGVSQGASAGGLERSGATVPSVPEPEASRAARSSRATTWASSRLFRDGFIALAGASPALGDLLLKFWAEFRPELWQTGWVTRGLVERKVATLAQSLGDREFTGLVRRIQRVESLRIAYLDCVLQIPVDQITLQISTLADALVSACYERALTVVAQQQGKVAPRSGFVVLALGKLGGMELNYSSDVDLNFVYDETLPALETLEGKRVEDPHEIERFFTQLAQCLVSFVTAFAEDGRLYRLDARLRPGGSSSRLVWSVRSSVDYYYSMGRAWERQALIRMRPMAGDIHLGERLRAEIAAFVFPASLTADQIAEIRGLKLQMERLSSARGPSESEIKVGRGGIRDVEYIVQYLQLIHAARIPALKTANIFQALEVLDHVGLLKPEETDVLRRGYRFLRKVEHRIQMAHLRQTHRLPDEPRELSRLARGLSFPDAEAFREHLARQVNGIRRVYSLLFEEATAQRDEAQELSTLLELPLDVAVVDGAGVVVPFGFRDAERAFTRLHALANPGGEQLSLDAHRTKEVFVRLAGNLLREVSLEPEPDQTLANFEECVRVLGARSVFYQLLEEDSRILRLFVEICSRSSLVVEILRAHADVFDEVVDCMLTGYRFSRESLLCEVERMRRESMSFERDLFKIKYLHLLLIAIRDLMRLDNLSNTLSHIASVGEAVLQGVLGRTLEQAEAKFGAWSSAPPRFVVLGLGKLGGQEMSYKSDLDLVIIYTGEGSTRNGVGTQEFFERVAQMLLQTCAVSDSLGPLLRIDLRLRPLGSHNSLAISLEAWKQYFRGSNARTWERQAFLRARPIAGDEGLSEEVLAFIRSEMVLGGSAGPPSEAATLMDVWEMRKMIEGHAQPGDLKKGEGGILDVEFLVQALQLCHGKPYPEVIHASTPASVRSLLRAGIVESVQGSELLTAYEFLRWVENRLSLIGEAGRSFDSMSPTELDSLAQKIGYKSSGEESAAAIFRGELSYHRKRNRAHLLRVLRVSWAGEGA